MAAGEPPRTHLKFAVIIKDLVNNSTGSFYIEAAGIYARRLFYVIDRFYLIKKNLFGFSAAILAASLFAASLSAMLFLRTVLPQPSSIL